jgi:hypothetical protein
MNTIDQLVEAAQEAADWLCECSPFTDQWERGDKLRRVLKQFKISRSSAAAALMGSISTPKKARAARINGKAGKTSS